MTAKLKCSGRAAKRVIFLVCVAPLLTTASASSSVVLTQDAPRAEATSDSYNANFDLTCGPAPQIDLALGVDADSPLVVSLTPAYVRVAQTANGTEHALAVVERHIACADLPVTIRVRKRPWSVAVDVNGQQLVSTGATPCGGAIGLAESSEGCELTNVYVQPIEPFLFSEEFFPDEGAADRWEPVSGQWVLKAFRDPLVEQQNGPIAASWYEASGASCLSVTGYDFWEDCAMEVAARTEDGRMGIVLGYAEEAEPILLELSATTCSLRRGGPDGETIAEAQVDGKPGLWHRLRLEEDDSGVRAMVDGSQVLAAPIKIAPGRAGLFASGERVEFDDVRVESLERFALRPGPDALDGFTVIAGRFGADTGGLFAEPASRAIALARTSEWVDAEAQAVVRAAKGVEAGVLAGAVRRGHGYAFGVEETATGLRWRLRWLQSSQPEVLAEGVAMGGAAETSLKLTLIGSRIEARIQDAVVSVVHDFRERGGRTGIYADGAHRAEFAEFEAQPVEDTPFVVGSLDGSRQMMLDPTQSGNVSIPVIGYIWLPQGSGLVCADASGEPILRPGSGATKRGLMYREPCAGDIEVSATLPEGPGSGATLAAFAQGPGEPGAYELRLRSAPDAVAELVCRGEVVATSALSPTAAAMPISLRCDGPYIIASVGDERMTHHDDAPAESGYVSILASGDTAPAFDDVELLARTATAYTFGHVVTEWDTISGRWATHSGMSCIPLDYWITGYAEPTAELVAKAPTTRDCLVRVSVSEYTEGYESGEHLHFPYHDFSVAVGRRPGEPESGYGFIIGADGGHEVRLLRDGLVVASTDDARFRMSMGPHCNTPRNTDVVVERSDGVVSLLLQGVPALSYTDASPLPSGSVTLSVAGCQANFRDLVIYERQPPR